MKAYKISSERFHGPLTYATREDHSEEIEPLLQEFGHVLSEKKETAHPNSRIRVAREKLAALLQRYHLTPKLANYRDLSRMLTDWLSQQPGYSIITPAEYSALKAQGMAAEVECPLFE